MSLVIRDITSEDMLELARLYVNVYTNFDIGEKWTEEAALKMLGWNYKRNPDLAILVELDGRIAGAFMVAVKPWWDGNHLVDGEIFVDTQYQQQGLGSRLLEQILHRAKENYQIVGYDTYTFRATDYPLKWYQSIGFEENNEWVMIGGDIQTILKKLSEKREKKTS